ncbi:MAG: hypothetical protein EOP53_00390 [Sphingobacteriales bacterium]|nr:MAG: hypothetical protein EOP53_00390 [Sphingobacteriales bacterium]
MSSFSEYLNRQQKIIEGLKLSFERLLEKKVRNDEEFVFSENGKIVTIKARELKKQREEKTHI